MDDRRNHASGWRLHGAVVCLKPSDGIFGLLSVGVFVLKRSLRYFDLRLNSCVLDSVALPSKQVTFAGGTSHTRFRFE